MQLDFGTINFVQVETKTGIKEFELFRGDITNLPFYVDLLTISAFKDNYTPTPNSIIGQLFIKGIDIGRLSKNPKLDFRQSLGIWVTDELDNDKFNNSFETAIKNLFAVISLMEMKGYENEIIAIPLLGTGDQSFDIDLVVPAILEASLDFLMFSRFLKKIYFIVYSIQKTLVFNDAMNANLGRKKLKSPTGELAELLKKDLNLILDKLISKDNNQEIFNDFKRLLNSKFAPFEFGAISRKTIEYIIDQINPITRSQFELIKKIDGLTTIKISLWIQSYLHLIRVFGNEAVHNKNSTDRTPTYVDSKDLEVGIYCMVRILEFYSNYKPS